MSILLLTTTLEGGGAARVLTHMANHWAAQGRSVSLVSFEDGASPPFYPLDPRVRVLYLALNRFSPTLLESLRNNWHRLRTMRRTMVRERPRAVISFIDTANVRTLLALLGTGIPVIISERVHPAHERIGAIWNLMRRLTYPLASRLVVQTREIADYCRWWTPRGVEVVGNPVLPMPDRGDAPRLPRPCLLAVGRLYPQKNYGLLLRAFAQAATSQPDWTLCVAGLGPQRQELERLARELGLDSRVRFLGHVADVGGLLAQADAYALSSLYEGFPNALCEAMAAGLPCVSTDCPSGPADIVKDGENGLLTPSGGVQALAGALARLMADEGLRQRLGAAARDVSRRFHPDRIMAQWDELIQAVSAGRQGGRP